MSIPESILLTPHLLTPQLLKSISERASSEKLAQQRCRRHLIVGDRLDITKETKQAAGLAVLGSALGHKLEKRLGLRLYHGKLEQHGRIEHHVGILLVRKYPLVFSRTHRRPATYGIQGAHATILVVADDPAQQTVVRRGNIVVRV